MWVYEEEVEGRKLTEIINTDHVNVKYLPDVKLPENVVAVPDLAEAVKDATILVFVLPHQVRRAVGWEQAAARALTRCAVPAPVPPPPPPHHQGQHPPAGARHLPHQGAREPTSTGRAAASVPTRRLTFSHRVWTLTTRALSSSVTSSATAWASRRRCSWAPTWPARWPRTSSRRPPSGARARNPASPTPGSSRPRTST